MPSNRATFIFLTLAVCQIQHVSFGQEECTDCHQGQKEKAKKIVVRDNSVHADLDCEECHVDAESPHGEKLRPVKCVGCHTDEAVAVKRASHGARIDAYLQDKGITAPSAKCLVCHGTDPHNILSAQDRSSRTNRSRIASSCLECHGEGQTIAIEHYVDSVHATAIKVGRLNAAECVDCHGSHSIDNSGISTSKVFHLNVPKTCGTCHQKEQQQFIESKHWIVAKKGFRQAPVCTDCHGEHGIRSRRDPLSPIWVGNITKTCASCHASEKLVSKFMVAPARVKSFQESFHGLSGELGDLRVANCSSCHGNHSILPSSDPRSSIHPSNLGRTCGRCHPGAKARFTAGRIHTTVVLPSNRIVEIIRTIYIWLIVITIGGMFIHNFLDLICKATRGTPYHREEELVPRFTISERIQHGILAISFVLLAVTGFALKFPESPFGWLFRWSAQGPYVRRMSHRVAAIIFLCLIAYHIAYVLVSTRGRKNFAAMLPRLDDIRDFFRVMRCYFFPFAEPLKLRHYTYVEKLEYWAVAWGTLVMFVSGLILFFINTSLANLPLWVVDLAATVHFLEAVLACLAIIVWHGYWVILDPEIYPMNLTWLFGSPRPKKHDTD